MSASNEDTIEAKRDLDGLQFYHATMRHIVLVGIGPARTGSFHPRRTGRNAE